MASEMQYLNDSGKPKVSHKMEVLLMWSLGKKMENYAEIMRNYAELCGIMQNYADRIIPPPALLSDGGEGGSLWTSKNQSVTTPLPGRGPVTLQPVTFSLKSPPHKIPFGWPSASQNFFSNLTPPPGERGVSGQKPVSHFSKNQSVTLPPGVGSPPSLKKGMVKGH